MLYLWALLPCIGAFTVQPPMMMRRGTTVGATQAENEFDVEKLVNMPGLMEEKKREKGTKLEEAELKLQKKFQSLLLVLEDVEQESMKIRSQGIGPDFTIPDEDPQVTGNLETFENAVGEMKDLNEKIKINQYIEADFMKRYTGETAKPTSSSPPGEYIKLPFDE